MVYLDFYRIAKGAVTPYTDPRPMKTVLGGKGAGLYEMVNMGLNVPPAFCIPTDTCNAYAQTDADHGAKWIADLMAKVFSEDQWLAETMGYAPLVSVRSGAPVSMPGMMDTILNVGLTEETLPFWVDRLGERAAWDSLRRLIQMLGATAYGIDMGVFDFQLARIKKLADVTEDKDLGVNNLKALVGTYLKVFEENVGHKFPVTREDQLTAAVFAVFNSWKNPRAIEYRKINNIDPAMGTACNIQAMVFGNLNDDSGTGVLFTRNPSTGEDVVMGEFLPNAQGEDVVAGIRTPLSLDKMGELPNRWPKIAEEIGELCYVLEEHYKDMVDIEFTVQDGVLYVLQSRVGKRSAGAAFKIAYDMVMAQTIPTGTALKRLTAEQYKIVRRPTIDPKFKATPNHTGLAACPGVVSGRPVYSSEDAVKATDDVILVTHETDPDDIAGMNKAKGILTAMGGATSHAAVVARAMDKPCVVGCTSLDLAAIKKAKVKRVTIDGSSGRVWFETEVPIIDASSSPELAAIQNWCLEACNFSRDVDFVDGKTGPMTVFAAHWWGDADAMEVAIDELAELPSREGIFLDVRSPEFFAQKEDSLLYDCFGHGYGSMSVAPFYQKMADYLLTTPNLDGLVILNPAYSFVQSKAAFKIRGITFTGEPATLADLFDGSWATTPDFINDVVGGQAAFEKLMEMMTAAGIKPKPVRIAASPDYAVFTALTA